MDYSQIIQSAAEAIICLDQERQILLFNESAEYLFGYSAHEVRGRLFDLLLPTNSIETESLATVTQETADPNYPFVWHGKYVWGRHKNNSTFPMVLNISKSVPEGETAVYTLIIRDATQELEAENIFKQSYQELMLLNHAARDLNATLDKATILQRLLDKVQSILNVEACSVWLIDPTSQQLVCEETTSPYVHEVINWQLPSGAGNADWVIEHGKGVIIPDTWLSEYAHPALEDVQSHIRSILTAPIGNPPQIIGVIQIVDTSPDRFSESDLLLVESLAAFAKIAIENARLYSALEEAQGLLIAQERFAALGQMAATVAHELRNPLTAIRMGVDYLLQGMDQQDSRWRGAALMKTNMDRIDRLVEDILFVGRRQPPVLSEGWLRPLIIAEVERWQLTLADRRLTLQTHISEADDLQPVLLDKEQMTRTLSNLIANSVDALPPDGKITLSFYQEGGEQIICVGDNGPGISPANLPQIFEPFFTTRARGTGLGLSIVKRIIDQHHGKISVKSDLAKGTTFTIYLPVIHHEAN